MNILIKLTCLIGLVIAPILGGHTDEIHAEETETVIEEVITEEIVAPVETSNLVQWTGRKVGGAHEGTLSISESTLKLEEGNLTGSLTIDMNSLICTDIEPGEDNDNMIGHLRSNDFFAIDSFQTAAIIITSATEDEKNENYYNVTADLTIKGITNAIEFPAMVIKSNDKIEQTMV